MATLESVDGCSRGMNGCGDGGSHSVACLRRRHAAKPTPIHYPTPNRLSLNGAEHIAFLSTVAGDRGFHVQEI